MIFEGKPTSSISVDELRQLVENHTAEDRYLDFKQEPYNQSDLGTRELIKDVTAFANADGGYIILGVEEDGQGQASAFSNVEEPEAARQSMIDRCLARIEPRLRELDIGLFDIDGNSVLVVRVPESDRKPHCAKPDAEHHYFWRRYEDGNKLMTTAEIRECFEGDRIEIALAEIRRELQVVRREHVVVRESSQEINEDNLLQLQSDDVFLQHIEERFQSTVVTQPFYRLWACPLPVNRINLRDHRTVLLELLRNPPHLRPHGWDLTPITTIHQTSIGLATEATNFHHLELLWNGYLEFRTSADDDYFHWNQATLRQRTLDDMYPYAIVEPVPNLILLTQEICRIAGYSEQIRFGLGLYNIRGKFLVPGPPESFGYRRHRHLIQAGHTSQAFSDEHLRVPPVIIRADTLPGMVAWQLVREVYYRFGYLDEAVPFFDEQHQYTLGRRGSG
jgi:hypothetical protein